MNKLSTLAFISFASITTAHAAVLQFNDQTTPIPGYQFFTKGADIATHYTPITQPFVVPNAPGKNIPVNTNMLISSCTNTTCTQIGYPTSSVGWSATSYNGQYRFDYGVDSSQWTHNHVSMCLNIRVNGFALPPCCGNSSSWKNCSATNVNFNSASKIVVTLSNN